MNGEPMLPRDPATGHFLPRPKPKRWAVSRTAVEIAVILLLASTVIFVGLAGMAKRRELRAAQAEVERLKAQPKPIEWSSGQSVNAAVIAFDASTVDCKFDGSLWMCRAKPQPRRAALPPYQPSRGFMCADGDGQIWNPRPDGRCLLEDAPHLHVAMPFDPEEDRWGKVGPMTLPVDVQNDGGKWVPWHRLEVPRKQR